MLLGCETNYQRRQDVLEPRRNQKPCLGTWKKWRHPLRFDKGNTSIAFFSKPPNTNCLEFCSIHTNTSRKNHLALSTPLDTGHCFLQIIFLFFPNSRTKPHVASKTSQSQINPLRELSFPRCPSTEWVAGFVWAFFKHKPTSRLNQKYKNYSTLQHQSFSFSVDVL